MTVAMPLFFGMAGSAIGATFGYAALGYTIGATIGSMLFAPKQQDQHFYGARLQDLRATQVEYGSPIHVRLGQTRGAGTVVWQSDFREVATTTTQESGGKGGGGGATSSQTTYTYFVDLLLLVNDIPSSGLLRVWKNNELVYNLSPTATDADIAALPNYVTSLIAGVGSGSLASVVCAPLDLVRTRMQVAGGLGQSVRKAKIIKSIYDNFLICIIKRFFILTIRCL
jgi:hypothetical protein